MRAAWPERFGAHLAEFLHGFDAETVDLSVVHPIGNGAAFLAGGAGDALFFAANVALVFQIGLDDVPDGGGVLREEFQPEVGRANYPDA